MNKVLVTGGSGLVGKTLKDLENNFIYVSSKDVNLLDTKETNSFFSYLKPSRIVHLAAKVGGIKDNFENPYDFISNNNLINHNVINYCTLSKTPIIFISSTCVYPAIAESYPMEEEQVHKGDPEPTNSSYAYAKRFAKNLLESAKKQYNLDYTILYFCNLYGSHDHFNNDSKSHLVTALIKKFHEAKIKNIPKVELMGTGNPYRQFMHAKDAANVIKLCIEKEIKGEFNFAIDSNLRIKDIAEIIKKIVGYKGDFYFNGNLDGVYRKDVCSDKILKIIGKYKFIDLESGATETYQGFLKCGN